MNSNISMVLRGSVIFGAAICLTSTSQAQAKRSRAASDQSSMLAASVNGEVITRGMVYDDLLLDQVSNLKAMDPVFRGKQRAFATTLGAFVAKKLAAANGPTASISREDVISWIFTDKQDIVTKTVERMIQERAVAQAAKRAGLKVTPAEMDAQTHQAIASARKNYPILEGKTDEQVLAAMGFRRSYLKPFVETQLYLEKMIQLDMTKQFGHPLGIDDYRGASHILIAVHPDPNNPKNDDKIWADMKAKADGILADIRSNKVTFEAAATQFSDDGSKFQNGTLGVFPRGQMVGDFEKAAFSLDRGKISDPVKTQFGWHIIRVDKLGTDITGPERAQVLQRMMAQKMPGKVQEILAKSSIVNKVPPAPSAGVTPGMQGGQQQ
ncbi:MAG: peptidylprolyl isomerase [Chthonomonadales bacterium]